MAAPLNSDRRVVVTGMGLVSCLGLTLDEVSESLRAGKSGIALSEERIGIGFRSALTGALPELDGSEYFSKKIRKSMPEHVLYSAIAAKKAFEESGTPEEIMGSDRAGLIIGNDSSAGAAREVLDTTREDGTTQGLGSGAVVRSMNSSPTINLGPLFKIRGASLTASAACASGAHAIGLAWLFIKLGWLDLAMTGGCQELCWESMAAFDALRTFSARTDEPDKASRPFSRDRDGLVPSGGGAMLFLEELELARARGAKIYGEVIGYALSADGTHITFPNAEGPERCMRLVFEQTGVSPSEVDYINAHATSTIAGDMAENQAIHAVFGREGAPVSSTKSMTGHECWMAGASEAIYSLIMMRDSFIAPNINFAGLADDAPEINIVDTAQDKELNLILSNSFGFGGTNACLLLKKYRE